jgi:hypothetical protein
LGSNPIRIALSEADKITVLPLFLMRNILGKYLISTPSLEYAGICGDTEQVKIDLFKRAKEIAIENNVFELRQTEIRYMILSQQ